MRLIFRLKVVCSIVDRLLYDLLFDLFSGTDILSTCNTIAVLMHEPNKIMKPTIRFILNKFGAFYFQIVEFLFEISWFCIKKGFRKKYKESLSKAYLVVVRIQSVYMV